MKLIYKVQGDLKSYGSVNAETIEILEQRGTYLDHSFVFVGKNNNKEIKVFEVILDEVSDGV